jgi:ribose-phosphate pyrophosphokinase
VVHFDGIPVEELAKKDFLIVDDICDGGRTFIELAKVLRPWTTGKIYLYVTHGIFSNGLDVFNSLIDGVYTANPFPKVDLNHKLLTVVSA